MKKYVLDTNLYVKAFRNEEGAKELERYFTDFTPNTYLSSVVFHELLVGASTPSKVRQIREDLLGPLTRAGRVITPSHPPGTRRGPRSPRWHGKNPRTEECSKSLVNDFLLAASCREAGATLVTDNTPISS